MGSPVINEVELNPSGNDNYNSVSEWVELYNPTDISIDISGWKISTTQGETHIFTMSQGTVLNAKSYYVFESSSQWLDNNDESVILMNSEGTVIDQTPLLSDEENDDGSWQRYPNGEANWNFRYSTKLSSNGGLTEPEPVPAPSEPEPSEPEPSEPEPSEPEPSEPEPSEPEASEPEPSEPKSSEPEPSEPVAPQASFTYYPLSPQVNDTLTFDASSCSDIDGMIVSYSWDFGDGENSTSQNPTHIYDEEGSYSVTLTIVDNNGLTDTTTVSIGEIVIPEFPSWIILPFILTCALVGVIYKKKLQKMTN